jgi:hypothetical protein
MSDTAIEHTIKEHPEIDQRELARDRSLQASKISNEHSRATAQVCILINGGAATAVLALLSKDKLDPTFVTQVSLALAIYAVGVLLGTFTIYCATEAMDYWSQHWLARIDGSGDAGEAGRKADWWWGWYRRSSLIAMVCFVVASLWLAHGLCRALHVA